MVLSIASNLQTRQLVWVRNGVKIHSAPAATWAALGRNGRLWSATINEVHPPPIIMNFPYLNNSQVEELNEFGVIELTDELMAIINQWGSDDDSESNLD
jgi:hypothetical protein